jgi:hypothetical protein
MTSDLHDLGPDRGAGSDDARGGHRTRVTVLTRGWAAALAALVISAFYLAGRPQFRPARQVSLGESAGQARAITFGPRGELLSATMLDGAIRLWRIDPGSGRAVPLGPAVPGFVAALATGGGALAAGGFGPTVWLWDVPEIPGQPPANPGPPGCPVSDRRAVRTNRSKSKIGVSRAG